MLRDLLWSIAPKLLPQALTKQQETIGGLCPHEQ